MQFGSDVAIQIFPAGKGILVLRHAQHTDQHRWIRAQAFPDRPEMTIHLDHPGFASRLTGAADRIGYAIE